MAGLGLCCGLVVLLIVYGIDSSIVFIFFKLGICFPRRSIWHRISKTTASEAVNTCEQGTLDVFMLKELEKNP